MLKRIIPKIRYQNQVPSGALQMSLPTANVLRVPNDLFYIA